MMVFEGIDWLSVRLAPLARILLRSLMTVVAPSFVLTSR
jgi:hypothetical protein